MGVFEYRAIRPLLSKALELILLDRVDSTNNYAMRLARGGYPGDAAVIAREQTGGKGTRGRSFFSPRDSGMYLSVLLHTGRKIGEMVLPTPAAAVAVRRAIREVFALDTGIKWVNDLLVGGRKVCGILAESHIDSETKEAVIVIGAGVNLTAAAFPEELSDKVAAIAEFRPVTDVNRFAAVTANYLLQYAKRPDPERYLGEYRAHSVLLGKKIRFSLKNTDYTGLASDITRDGNLLVRLSSGEEMLLSSGDVSVALL